MSTPSLKLEALADMIERDGADPKPTMLRVLTDFYVQKTLHTPEEDRHFTELALRLIGEVDGATRADIARRLKEHGGAPPLVMRRLSEAETSAPDVFQFADNTRVPAQTAPVAEPAPSIIPERPAISANDRAAAVGFSERFFSGDSGERRALLRALEGGSVTPLGIAAHEASVACRELEGAALRSRPFEFVREMERALAIPRTIAQKIINDSSGEPMLVVAKALGMTTDALQRILLLVNPAIGTSVRRVFDLTELYQNMSVQSALRLISLWRYAAERDDASGSSPREAVGTRRAAPEAPRAQSAPAQGEPAKRDQRAI